MRRKTIGTMRTTYLIIAVSVCALGLLAGCFYIWNRTAQFQDFCQRAYIEKRQEIRPKTPEEVVDEDAEHRRRQRQAADAQAEAQRAKWSRVIAAVTQQIRSGQTALDQESDGVVQFVSTSTTQFQEKPDQFWSHRRLRRASPPAVGQIQWCRNPIDQFILARLEKAGLKPNEEASRQALARRLSFDMLGLSPRPEDVDAFVANGDPSAYEKHVEKLLQHAAFGEHWARAWLDLARYADSNGYEEDEERPHAYPYRDFVIWAMNQDLPYDVFVRWQIAGDEVADPNPLSVAATGFLSAGPYNTFMPQESERYDELDDIVSTIGHAMLGMTIGCARCHDHKYDPISTDEYYGMVAIFAQTERTQSYLALDGGAEYRRWADPVDQRRAEIEQILRARVKEDNISELDYFTEEEKNILRQPIDPQNDRQQRLLSLCERCLLITPDDITDDLEPLPADRERYDRLMAEISELEPSLPDKPPVALTVTGSSAAVINVLQRGSLKHKGAEVGPGFLSAITPSVSRWGDDDWQTWHPDAGEESPTPRRALANWLTDVKGGAGSLLARVIVNRLWQQHFGQGLVRTPNDFGTQGSSPSHPELLQWLACELVENNWSLKHIHRLIVTSAAYRQSSGVTPEKARRDPLNRLLSRWRMRRLTAEMMRDAMLTVSGEINMTMYGPAVKPPIPKAAVFHTQDEPEDTWPFDAEADRPAVRRRGIYVSLKRTVPVPMLRLFDAPDGSYACGRRQETTTPTQALALLNSPFVQSRSEQFAQRVLAEANSHSDVAANPEQLVRRVFLLALARPPDAHELRDSLSFLRQAAGDGDPAAHRNKLADLCHVLFMTNEFSHFD